ncbi:mCG147466 [Mus musculus]|jgi:hypothetical protein|nr:mCG147466 [Mus musculus]
MPVMSTLRRWGQEDPKCRLHTEFKTSLEYLASKEKQKQLTNQTRVIR